MYMSEERCHKTCRNVYAELQVQCIWWGAGSNTSKSYYPQQPYIARMSKTCLQAHAATMSVFNNWKGLHNSMRVAAHSTP